MFLKNILLCIFSLLFSIGLFSQKKLKAFDCDSIFIYSNYDSHGTTARVSGNHRMLDSTGHEKSKLSNDELQLFQSFTSSNKSKKLFQMKYGSNGICYLQIYSEGKPYRFVAYGNETAFSLHNLDGMRYYETDNATEATKLTEIIKKYWR